jgi:hypothetical protein
MSVLSAKDREEYLLLLYFGASPKSRIGRCVRRAYRDMNRTLHGLSTNATNKDLGESAHNLLERNLEDVLGTGSIGSQAAFDSWHRQLTTDLCSHYQQAGFENFFVGQAQKWINMALKYAVIFGEERIAGISWLFPWLHVPIDRVVLEMSPGAPALTTPWSRLNDYCQYFSFQEYFRKRLPAEAPLAIEFRLWQEGMEKSAKLSAEPK